MTVILQRLENADSELVIQKNQEKEEILFIPLNKLKLNPNRIRKVINREDIWDMAKNIKSFGMGPII